MPAGPGDAGRMRGRPCATGGVVCPIVGKTTVYCGLPGDSVACCCVVLPCTGVGLSSLSAAPLSSCLASSVHPSLATCTIEHPCAVSQLHMRTRRGCAYARSQPAVHRMQTWLCGIGLVTSVIAGSVYSDSTNNVPAERLFQRPRLAAIVKWCQHTPHPAKPAKVLVSNSVPAILQHSSAKHEHHDLCRNTTTEPAVSAEYANTA